MTQPLLVTPRLIALLSDVYGDGTARRQADVLEMVEAVRGLEMLVQAQAVEIGALRRGHEDDGYGVLGK